MTDTFDLHRHCRNSRFHGQIGVGALCRSEAGQFLERPGAQVVLLGDDDHQVTFLRRRRLGASEVVRGLGGCSVDRAGRIDRQGGEHEQMIDRRGVRAHGCSAAQADRIDALGGIDAHQGPVGSLSDVAADRCGLGPDRVRIRGDRCAGRRRGHLAVHQGSPFDLQVVDQPVAGQSELRALLETGGLTRLLHPADHAVAGHYQESDQGHGQQQHQAAADPHLPRRAVLVCSLPCHRIPDRHAEPGG